MPLFSIKKKYLDHKIYLEFVSQQFRGRPQVSMKFLCDHHLSAWMTSDSIEPESEWPFTVFSDIATTHHGRPGTMHRRPDQDRLKLTIGHNQ